MRGVWGLKVNDLEQLQTLNNKTIITEKHKLLIGRKGHFFNCPMNCQQLNSMWLTTLNKGQPNAINAQTWIKWVTFSLCRKCPDVDKVSNIFSMLHNGNSPGANGSHLEVIKRRGRRLVKVFYIIIEKTWKSL